MKKPHLLCIVPYEGMYEAMKGIAARRNDVTMSIFLGDMEEGVNIARENLNESVDIIISRGRTGQLIYSNFPYPVCNITFSPFDILRAIRAAMELSSSFAILGAQEITDSARLLCESLQYGEVIIVPTTEVDEIEEALLSLKRQGCTLIVGDRITVTTAQKLDLRHILITSGTNSIEDAIDHAVRLCEFNETARKKTRLLQQALRAGKDATILFDARSVCIFSTMSPSQSALLPVLKDNLNRVWAEGEINLAVQEKSQHFSVRGKAIRLDDDTYAYFQVSELIPKAAAASAITIYNRSDFVDMRNQFFWGSSQRIADFLETAKKLTNATHHVYITGAQLTELFELAVYLYTQSRFVNSPFVHFDCSDVTQKQWSSFLESSESPLYREDLTLYLHNIGRLTPQQKARLFAYIESSKTSGRLFIILSCCTAIPGDPCVSSGELERLSASFINLRVPSLREHPADIAEISNLFINRISAQYGKQLIGLSPEAMRYLQDFEPINSITQLKQCLLKAILATDTAYISAQTLGSILSQDCEETDATDVGSPAINLSRPLKEIEREIIQHVYQRENMNQTQTARKLGISRSTLWRVLNE